MNSDCNYLDVRHEVASVFEKERIPVFCHRYPSLACAAGNGGV
jgi:hypothetical protein